MSRERLRLYLRRHQLVDDDLGNVVVQCNPDGTAEYVPGTVDGTWVEFTDLAIGLDKLSLAWDSINTGADSTNTETNPGGSNYDKGISLELQFNDAAYTFIYAWLLADACSSLNVIDVRITDALAGITYRIFEIKADNLTERPIDQPCQISVRLREADPAWHCIHKTFIWDNWQEWFIDGGAKQHPCFLTAVEPRPRLIASARMGISIFGQTIPLISALFNENENVFRRILNVDNFVDSPLVRDIITNVAGKCGLTVDTIFHDPDGPYYNLCLFYPSAGQWHVNDGINVLSPALWFHFENRWNVTLAEFLDKLKAVFHAEWYVTPNNTLVFKNELDFVDTTPIYDFTQPNALPMWDLEYTFNGVKKPAYGRYQYTIDASDLACQEAQPQYNDIVDYDGPTNNPMLEGSRSMNLDFASTGFVRDGRARGDYMRDLVNDGETVAYALLIILGIIVAALVAGVASAVAGAALAATFAVWAGNIASKANSLRDTFGSAVYTGAVRITADQVATPRLLLWDGEDMERAKVVQQDPNTLTPSDYYNPDGDPYTDFVTFQYTPVGGLFVNNFPMYFDSNFTGNLFDRFHDVLDNPLKSLDSHRAFSFETDLCAEALQFLGVADGQFARIGYRIKLESRPGYDIFGRIEHFDVNYDTDRIAIRGRILKVKT
jgi:hypothetical protein